MDVIYSHCISVTALAGDNSCISDPAVCLFHFRPDRSKCVNMRPCSVRPLAYELLLFRMALRFVYILVLIACTLYKFFMVSKSGAAARSWLVLIPVCLGCIDC